MILLGHLVFQSAPRILMRGDQFAVVHHLGSNLFQSAPRILMRGDIKLLRGKPLPSVSIRAVSAGLKGSQSGRFEGGPGGRQVAPRHTAAPTA